VLTPHQTGFVRDIVSSCMALNDHTRPYWTVVLCVRTLRTVSVCAGQTAGVEREEATGNWRLEEIAVRTVMIGTAH
jgi:hypothetical protein